MNLKIIFELFWWIQSHSTNFRQFWDKKRIRHSSIIIVATTTSKRIFKKLTNQLTWEQRVKTFPSHEHPLARIHSELCVQHPTITANQLQIFAKIWILQNVSCKWIVSDPTLLLEGPLARITSEKVEHHQNLCPLHG